MRRRDSDPETSGAARYARITNRRNEKSFLLQGVRKVHRIVLLADDEWKNRTLGFVICLAGNQLMKQIDIFPKRTPAFLTLWSLQEFDRRNRRGGNRRWWRR